MESGNESDDYSALAPLIIESEMDTMSSGNQSDTEPMSTEILEDIRYGSQYHPGICR